MPEASQLLPPGRHDMSKALRLSPAKLLPGALALGLLLAATGAHAQGRPFPYALGTRDLLVLPASFGFSALGESIAEGRRPITVQEIAALDPHDVNPFDRPATRHFSTDWDERSDAYQATLVRSALLGLFVPAALRGKAAGVATVGTMLAESYFLLKGVTYTTKGLVGRKRPYLYNTSMSAAERLGVTGEGDNDAVLSFFSGHAASSFLAATLMSQVFTDVYGRSTWSNIVWGTSLSMAALTSYARVRAGMHYPSDVVAGAVVGGAIGILVPRLHRRTASGRVTLIAGPARFGLSLRLGASRPDASVRESPLGPPAPRDGRQRYGARGVTAPPARQPDGRDSHAGAAGARFRLGVCLPAVATGTAHRDDANDVTGRQP